MSSYVYAVALGIAYAVFVRFSQQRSSRKKTEKRYPELMARWQSLDRRTRRSLTKAARSGLTVPAEHASIMIEMIDLSITIEGELMPTFRRRMIRAYVIFLTTLLVFVVALLLSDPTLRFVEIIFISAMTTMIIGLTVALVQARKRRRIWPTNRLRARELAQQQLDTGDADQV